MSTEGNDLKGRGRRLFSALRRQEESAAAPPEPTPTQAEATEEPASTEGAAPEDLAGAEAAKSTDEESEMSTTDVTSTGPESAGPAGGSAPPPAGSAWPEAGESTPEVQEAEQAEAQPEPQAEPEPTTGSDGADEAIASVTPLGARMQSVPHSLPPAEGGHVEPPASGPEAPPPASTRSRAGAGPLPGSSERSRSVGEADSDSGSGEDTGPEPYELPRVIAIANQKGGVGKTTTSVNLGASLAELEYRVLVVDLDPQGNATTGLGINARNLQSSVYDVIMSNAAIEDCVEPTSLKNLFVAPATIDLAGAEIELVPAFSRELKLRRALEEVRDEYDYVLIDCPPSLGLLTVNGLAAADDVIVPIQCEYYALEGLSQLIRNVTLVRTNLNPKLDVRGIVLTMYDARTKLADQVEQEVRGHFGRRVYQTVVPRTVRLSEAPSFGQPIIVFDSTSRGAVAYRELAKEVSSGATRRSG